MAFIAQELAIRPRRYFRHDAEAPHLL